VPDWRDRFGVVAGITARGTEPGRGFDLGLWTDAPVREVMARWRSFRHAEPSFGGVVLGNQVHGAAVAWHERVAGWVQLEGLDGHATASPGVLLAVTVADCIPVYLLDPRHRAVALLHAGWRGTAAGILGAGVRLLSARAGTDPADLVMHVGVGICGPCYEVGSEVMRGLGLEAIGPGPWHVDLRDQLVAQGSGLGIRSISRSDWCSAHDRPRFYSHRASKGADGRMVAYLGLG
jgi:polyphenol oxidase